MDVSRELVLQRFEAFRESRVEVSFGRCIPARLRGGSHDVIGAQQRHREQPARRVVWILDQIEWLASMKLFEFAVCLRAEVEPVQCGAQ